MKLTAYIKDIFREIKNSITKVLSILIMIALGALVINGLGHTGESMRDTLNARLNEMNTPDIKVTSTFGLDIEDQAIIENTDDLNSLVFSYTLDVYNEEEEIIRLHSLEEEMPLYSISEGTLPENANEIALDTFYAKDKYNIGDTIKVSSITEDPLSDSLKETEYEIVGFVDSPEYLMESSRGMSLIGKTSVSGFGLIEKDNFTLDDYSSAYMKFNGTEGLKRTSSQYIDYLNDKKSEIEDNIENRPEDRLAKIKADAEEEITDAEGEITDAERQLADARNELKDGSEELEAGFNDYEEGKAEFEREIADAQSQLDSAKSDLDEAEAEIASGRDEYYAGKDRLDRTISAAQGEINRGKSELVNTRVMLDEGWSKYMAGVNQLDATFSEAKAELDGSKAAIDQARVELDQAWAEYNALVNSREEPTAPDPTDSEETETPTEPQPEEPIDESESDTTELEDSETEAPVEDTETELESSESSSLGGSYRLSSEVLPVDSLEAMRSELEAREAEYNAGLAEYEAGLAELESQYNEQLAVLDQTRAELESGEAQYNAAMEQITNSEATLNEERRAGERELQAAYNALVTGQSTYQAGLDEYEAGLAELEDQRLQGEEELKDAYSKLIESEKELNDAYEQYEEESEDASSEISEGRGDIQEARENVLSLSPPTYSVTSIEDNPGISTYKTNSERMDALSLVFPFFFYLVAMLVTLTTMQRMIDEERIQIGTLKSLGYSNMQIAVKYYVYGLVPTLLGSILGSFLGIGILSRFIFDAYSSGFAIGDQVLNINVPLVLLTIVISSILILLTVHFTVRKTVSEVPSKLLRPKPPTSGSHVFLERIKPLWSRLSFMHKITARNIFRYKSRMFMTILGVGGCTALIFFGFAMRDSIAQYSDTQFGEIMKYDMISYYDNEADEEELNEYRGVLEGENTTGALYITGRVSTELDEQNVNFVVPEDVVKFTEFVELRERNGGDLELTDDGAIITEKLASMTNINIGDILTVYDDDDIVREIQIVAIAENYLNHYIYMTPAYYEQVFDEAPEKNADYIITENSDELENKLIDLDAVLSLVNISDMEVSASGLLDSLNLVILIILVISSTLAIVVLYNLTNVNVSERKRELSTIKVLGFYPREVTAYIYRETLILTVFGILLGYLGGFLLHRFIINLVAPDEIMLIPKILPPSFIISAIITLVISAIVMFILHVKLKDIDMVEALKGID